MSPERWGRSVAWLALALAVAGCAAVARPDRLEPQPPPPAAGAAPLPAGPVDPGPAPRTAAAHPPGVTLRFLAALDGGWTSQENHGSGGVIEVEAGGLVEWPRLTMGVLGRTGLRGAAAAGSLALAAGRSFERPEGRQLALLGELGVSRLTRSGKGSTIPFSSYETSGGDTTLPFIGARVLFGLWPTGPGFAVGLFAQQTLGTARSSYTEKSCFLLGCTTTQHAKVDGGFSAGVTIGFTHAAHLGPPAPDAAPR